uniref:peptidylprolyl isomerase n=1 Tax=Rhodnius neglectus TaxID=72488 RepID=A0A0P4VTD5_9HEMI
MAVVIETTVGDITVDLYTEERPQTCKNFLKLCKIKYYNFCLFHSIQANFIAQTGDPTGIGTGGESVFGIVYGNESRYYEGEKMPKIKHNKPGLLSMVNCGNNMLGSQFFVTLGTDLQSLEEHCVFAEVTEGHDILVKLNDAICDHQHRPYQDIRITHTVILDDPFEDLPGLIVPPLSPDLSQIKASNGRIGADEKINDEEGLSEAQLQEIKADREAKARATILEIVGDLPDADIAPPENVLFVCKLNPVTTDEDLEIIFSRFGKVKSCEVIRDHATGESLQYAFVEFEDQRSCEQAYLKMDNVLIDDRRIHVDFSQSVSKIKWKGKGRGVQYFDNKIDEKESSRSNSERYSGGKRDHYRERDRDRDRDRTDRRGRDEERRRRGGDRENDDHRLGRRNDRRREDRWGCEEDRWDEEGKRRYDRRRDDERRYNRRGDDRRRGGMDDDRRRGDEKKRNGTERRTGTEKDSTRRTETTDSKEERFRDSKSSFENKEDTSRRESSRQTNRDKNASVRKAEEKVIDSVSEIKSKEDVKDTNQANNLNTPHEVVGRVETFDEHYSNDNNYKDIPKEIPGKLSATDVPRRKKKRRRVSTSSNSTSSESSETSSSSTSIERKKKSKRSLTVAKKYYHKGKLVKIVKKKKNKSSDSETLSDESSDSDRRRKKRKYKKIVKVIKKSRRSDDSDSDSSSSEDSDSSRYRKKRRKSDRNNKKKRKENVKKNKKKKHYDSSETSDSELEKEKRKNKNSSNSKKHKIEGSD